LVIGGDEARPMAAWPSPAFDSRSSTSSTSARLREGHYSTSLFINLIVCRDPDAASTCHRPDIPRPLLPHHQR